MGAMTSKGPVRPAPVLALGGRTLKGSFASQRRIEGTRSANGQAALSRFAVASFPFCVDDPGTTPSASLSPADMNRLAVSRALRPSCAPPSLVRSSLAPAVYQRARFLSAQSEPATIPSAIPPAALRRRFHDLRTAMVHFSQVRGVGPKTAHAWAHAGCHSLDEVLAKDAEHGGDIHLTDYQRGNIRELTNHLSRVPVSELGDLETRLEGVMKQTDQALEGNVVAVASGAGFSSYKM